MLIIAPDRQNQQAVEFCEAFVRSTQRPRFILGRNEYAKSIAAFVDVTGFIDDFTAESEFLGKPIVRMSDIPADSLVVSSVVGRPLTAARRLDACGAAHLDYFSFWKYSRLDIKPARFGAEFQDDFRTHTAEYRWVYGLLCDEHSRTTFSRIIHFRLHSDLAYMSAFAERQDSQYFEEFLNLQPEGETFLDVGAYQGETSAAFIERCPGYRSVHLFEPDENNMAVARARLSGIPNVAFHPIGLSNKRQTLAFQPGGSASQIAPSGKARIRVDALDNVVKEPVTFIKMDIEGGESDAIEGARETLRASRPALAVCVYHKVDDLRRIPRQVLQADAGYDVYVRHYTEGVDETVMFFVPGKRPQSAMPDPTGGP